MNTNKLLSKTYKFKIGNVAFTIISDETFFVNSQNTGSVKSSSVKSVHFHSFNELFLICDDPVAICTENSKTEYKNQLVCIPAYYNHYSLRQRENYRILFSYEILGNNKTKISSFLERFSSHTEPFSIKNGKALKLYFDEIYMYMLSSDEYSTDIISSLFKVLFYRIFYDNTDILSTDNYQPGDSYLITIETMIENFQEDINLQKVADALFLSTKQASRIIIKNYKKPLAKLVKEKRLTAARNLLKNTDMTVSEIVEYVNFPSESYFYAQFKKAFNQTPLEFRKTKYN